MASNQRRKGLDQPAGDTLKALDRVLADMATPVLAADEFTAEMIMSKMPSLSESTLRSRLHRLIAAGVMTKRSVRVHGRIWNAYRYTSQ